MGVPFLVVRLCLAVYGVQTCVAWDNAVTTGVLACRNHLQFRIWVREAIRLREELTYIQGFWLQLLRNTARVSSTVSCTRSTSWRQTLWSPGPSCASPLRRHLFMWSSDQVCGRQVPSLTTPDRGLDEGDEFDVVGGGEARNRN